MRHRCYIDMNMEPCVMTSHIQSHPVAPKSHEADFLIRLLKWPRISHAAPTLSVLKLKDLHSLAQIHLNCCRHAWSVKGQFIRNPDQAQNSPDGRRWDEDPPKGDESFQIIIIVDSSDTLKTQSSCTKPLCGLHSTVRLLGSGRVKRVTCVTDCYVTQDERNTNNSISVNVYTVSEVSCRHTACRRVRKCSLFLLKKRKESWEGCQGPKSLADTVKDLFLRHYRSL